MYKLGAKRFIKQVLLKFGYQITQVNQQSSFGPDLFTWIKKTYDINTIIDIGSNDGSFGKFLFNYFNATHFVAFEPLPMCIPRIRNKFNKIDKVNIYEMALSDYTGEETLFQNSYAPASSILRVSNLSKTEFPKTKKEKPLKVKVQKLDSILDGKQFEHDIFIKLDVQGVEDKVIKGGLQVFSAAKFILIEMSFVPIYESQTLFEEVHLLLTNIGFRFGGIKNQINSEKTGQPLFCHCLYIKSK